MGHYHLHHLQLFGTLQGEDGERREGEGRGDGDGKVESMGGLQHLLLTRTCHRQLFRGSPTKVTPLRASTWSPTLSRPDWWAAPLRLSAAMMQQGMAEPNPDSISIIPRGQPFFFGKTS